MEEYPDRAIIPDIAAAVDGANEAIVGVTAGRRKCALPQFDGAEGRGTRTAPLSRF
jgi:hypothetical protein